MLPECGAAPTFEATGLAPSAIPVRERAMQERAFLGSTTSPAVPQHLPGFSFPAHTCKSFRPVWKKATRRNGRSVLPSICSMILLRNRNFATELFYGMHIAALHTPHI